MGILSADHVQVFLTIVEKGSFSAAARTLQRSQTAVSYAIQTLEEQLQLKLFERTGTRPKLSPAGAALLADAQRVAYSLQNLRIRADALARGLEPELAIAVDDFFPLEALASHLGEFAAQFPQVQLDLRHSMVGDVIQSALDGVVEFGIVSDALAQRTAFAQTPMAHSVVIAPVIAPHHPLASATGELGLQDLAGHVQAVPALHTELAFGIPSPRVWTCNNVRAMRAAILSGAAWGVLPHHLITGELAKGELLPFRLNIWADPGSLRFGMCAVHRADRPLGPAAQWWLSRLANDRPTTA